jgi:hypothetical protein
MSNSYSLADIKNDLDSKHQFLELDLGEDTINLLNPARLDAKARKQVMKDLKIVTDQAEMKEQDPIVIDEAINGVLAGVVADGKGQQLADLIAGDTELAFTIFNLWLEVTQAGEASSSPNS